MQRMRQLPFNCAAGGHHRLTDHLPAEHSLPTGLRAAAAEQVHLDRFEVENGEHVDQTVGHCVFCKLRTAKLEGLSKKGATSEGEAQVREERSPRGLLGFSSTAAIPYWLEPNRTTAWRNSVPGLRSAGSSRRIGHALVNEARSLKGQAPRQWQHPRQIPPPVEPDLFMVDPHHIADPC